MDVYLCHAPGDRAFAERLAHDVSSSWVPGHVRTKQLDSDDSLLGALGENEQLGNSLVALVLSPNSAGTYWVSEELDSLSVISLENRLLFPGLIILRECEIPPTLAGREYGDFRSDYERGRQGFAELFRDFESNPVYLRTVIRKALANPEAPIEKHALMDIIDNIDKLEIDIAVFDLLLAKSMQTDIFTGPLFLAGTRFYRTPDLVKKAISLRPMPFRKHHDFCVSYASRTSPKIEAILDYTGCRRFWRSVPMSDPPPLPYDLERELVEVLENLFSIGHDGDRAVLVLKHGCCHFRRKVYEMAVRTRQEVAVYRLLRDACSKYPSHEASLEAWEAIAANVDDVPAVRRLLTRAFTEGIVDYSDIIPLRPEVIPKCTLQHLELFPENLVAVFLEAGSKSELPPVREAVRLHRRAG